ncbi:MAG: non-heme iron oxygenase ferredoxin subunit [Candidatus Glassbacteria bacterium]
MSFVRAAAEGEVARGTALRVVIAGRPVAVVRTAEGRLFAVDDTCTHEEASLSGGFVEGNTIECPHHGATFDLETGRALTLPATSGLRTYEVKVEKGEILINFIE